jgi:hypothetical protein
MLSENSPEVKKIPPLILKRLRLQIYRGGSQSAAYDFPNHALVDLILKKGLKGGVLNFNLFNDFKR